MSNANSSLFAAATHFRSRLGFGFEAVPKLVRAWVFKKRLARLKDLIPLIDSGV